eukprot:4143543-Prymnesium_polylepis.1
MLGIPGGSVAAVPDIPDGSVEGAGESCCCARSCKDLSSPGGFTRMAPARGGWLELSAAKRGRVGRRFCELPATVDACELPSLAPFAAGKGDRGLKVSPPFIAQSVLLSAGGGGATSSTGVAIRCHRSRHSAPDLPGTCEAMIGQLVGLARSSIGTSCRNRASPPAGPSHGRISAESGCSPCGSCSSWGAHAASVAPTAGFGFTRPCDDWWKRGSAAIAGGILWLGILFKRQSVSCGRCPCQ